MCVIPAEAGTQGFRNCALRAQLQMLWVPACAGMTKPLQIFPLCFNLLSVSAERLR
jgi:hypothetical protein